jgi:hypothetical protein
MQAHYFLAPGAGKPFDLGQLELRLKQLPGAFLHPDPVVLSYVITPNARMAKVVLAQLSESPLTSLASQGIVSLAPTGVRIEQDAPEAVLAQLKTFVGWLVPTYACHIFSEEGDDWTARYTARPEALFEEESI